MFLATHPQSGTSTHRCEACGLVRDIPIEAIRVTEDDFSILCPCGSSEHMNHEATAYLATFLGPHPDSLVGFRFEDTGGIVVEDSRYELPAHTEEQIRHQQALHAHPLILAQRRAARAAVGLPDPLA